MMKKSNLTPKQEAFCHEYIIDCNGAKACIRAGYSKNTAKEKAWGLLNDPEVKELIDKLMSEKREKCKIDAEFVLNELIDVYKKCNNAYKLDANNALRALELVGKLSHVNAFNNKVDANLSLGANIYIQQLPSVKSDFAESEDEVC